jgi:hypothetical protein
LIVFPDHYIVEKKRRRKRKIAQRESKKEKKSQIEEIPIKNILVISRYDSSSSGRFQVSGKYSSMKVKSRNKGA